jgi:uncharacterized protein YbbK (DUF523 family)
MAPPVLVSACLLGVRCRYDGANRPDTALVNRLIDDGRCIVPVCPEQLGGLPTPRTPAEIVGGSGPDVLDGRASVRAHDGRDVTDQYVRGAEETLRIARLFGCRSAYLQEKSPACGVDFIKRGDDTCPGMGVAAALLSQSGVELVGADPSSPPE